jgi:CheY-like chemotaxis protein
MKMPPYFIVVDDDPVNNLLCQFGIRRFVKEAEIRIFTKPEDALEMILTDYADPVKSSETILFLDINMPSMTGWEFIDVFKGYETYIKKQFKIFILSSSVDDRDKERAGMSSLVSGFLSKPLKADDIKQILLQFEIDIYIS